MANSLIELYGGGMIGKSTNYQLGGRVASARRDSDYRGEERELKRAAREAQRKQSRASGLGSILGTVGSLAGSLIPIPGVGTAVGAAIGSAAGGGLGRLLGESTYQGTEVQGGKYAREGRGNLQGSVDDFKSSMGERALDQGLRSGLGTFISQGGADYLKAKFTPAEEMLSAGVIPANKQAIETAKEAYEGITPLGIADPSLDTFFDPNSIVSRETVEALSDVPLNVIPDTPITNFGYDDLVQYGTVQGPAMDFMPAMGGEGLRGAMGASEFGGFMRMGGLIDMLTQSYGHGGIIDSTATNMGSGINGDTIGDFKDQARLENVNLGETYGDSLQKQQRRQQQQREQARSNPGYGTATSAAGALNQMGMGNIMNDPRFADFAGDLPDFGMGYSQQIGDIYAQGKQATRAMRGQARQVAGQRGFSGSGIGQNQFQTSMGDLRTDIARQRRGVVEGYQSDVLGAIGDIERKGEFEFEEIHKENVPNG